MKESRTAKEQCLDRWPSLRLICRVQRGRYRITSGPLFIASGKTASSAWIAALKILDKETNEMVQTAWQKTLKQFGRGIQSASEGIRP